MKNNIAGTMIYCGVMSVSSEKGWRRLIFRWTAREGATAIALFLALAIIIEYLAVLIFRSYGLMDTQTFQASLAIFTLTISPLFHLIPLGVVMVLVCSWTYLTKHIARIPHRRTPTKKPSAKPRRPIKRGKKSRFRSLKSLSRKVSRALRAFHHRVKTGILRIRGVSPAMQRLLFARAAIRSTVNIVLIFLISLLVLYLLGFPNFIHDLVVGFYRSNPSFHRFVLGTIEAVGLIGQALSPIGWLASAVNGVLISASSGFRGSLEGFIVGLTGPLVNLDVVWKYVICQNIAAWFSAIVALVYGEYTTYIHRRYRR